MDDRLHVRGDAGAEALELGDVATERQLLAGVWITREECLLVKNGGGGGGVTVFGRETEFGQSCRM